MIGVKLSNRYEILREIGRGGMGAVYLAYDPLLEREVAIKLIPPASLSSEAEERFRREARVIAKMDHPSIVVAYDIGSHDGSLYFVMPFIRGTNLRHFLNERSLSMSDVLDIGIQVAEALEYSHSQGVIHRDVKPENILITREESASGMRVRVTDFGLAMVSSENRITRNGSFVGTVAYFSPEQVSGDEVDARTDVYSLATVLYECIVGETPFEGEIQSVLYRIANEDPVPPRNRNSEVDAELDALLMRNLAKDPSLRCRRAIDFAQLLRENWAQLDIHQTQPVISAAATAAVQRRMGARGAGVPFIGREKEIAELQRRFNESLSGECQFVVVAGEAGIGKSRLLDQLESLAKARKIRALHGRFVEQESALPYQGFCEAIQESFRSRSLTTSSSPPDFSDLAPDLIALFPVLSEIADLKTTSVTKRSDLSEPRKLEDRIYIFELLARALTRIQAGKPLLLLLEDLHAADVSLEALQYIVRRLGPTPTMIVGTYRTTEVDKRHPLIRMLNSFQGDRRFTLIQLSPFTAAEHQQYLATLAEGNQFNEEMIHRLYEATEGNPYFLKELVRSMEDSAHSSISADFSLETLPATIQQTVEKRIERLPENLRDILSIASILGRAFEFDDLEELTRSQHNLEEAVDQLIGSGFIEEEREARADRLAFCSGVVRDVLYTQLSRRKRRSLHRLYAESLETRFTGRLERALPQLVHHFFQADVPEKVVEYGLKLAQKSLNTFSAEEATRAIKCVLDCLEDEPALVEAEARTLLASAYRMSGNMEGALKELDRSMKIFETRGETHRAVSALLFGAETAWAGRRVEETSRWLEKGLEATRSYSDAAVRNRFLSLAATVANLRGEYDEANLYLEEIERLQPASQEWEEQIPQGGKLVVAVLPAIEAKFPSLLKLDEEEEILANVFETLLTTDQEGNLLPHLCERWERLEQGKSFLMTLRPNVRLQNGEALTAAHLKRSFEKAIRLSSSGLLPAFRPIRGAVEYLEGAADEVAGLIAVDELRLTISLTEPLPIYPALLTDARTGIVHEERSGNVTKLYGTGPFRIADMQTDRIFLERNSDYWKGSGALLDGIEFRGSLSAAEIAAGLRSGEFDLARDLLPQDLEEALRDRRFRGGLAEAPKKNLYFVLFNNHSEAGRDENLRRALFGIVRTHDLARRSLGRFAQPAEGLIPPGILGHDPGARHSPILREEAAALLRATHSTAPVRLKAAVHPILQDKYGSLTKALLQTWSDIGVEVTIETPTMSSYLARHSDVEGIDLLLGRYIADYDDPDNFTYVLFHSTAGIFHKYFCCPEVDQLTEEARIESRSNVRERLYREVENRLLQQNHLLPLFHDIDYRLASPRVRRLKLRSNPPYVNYSELGKIEDVEAFTPRKSGGGTIEIPIPGEISTLDPSIVFLVGQIEVIPTVFETLTRETEGARIVPCLAASFHAEAGSRRFRFHLREDVRFHDGRRLTARDVRYSFERLLLTQESASRYFLAPIRGAKELLDRKEKVLKGFQIESASEFVIELDQPVSFFPALVAYPSTAIVPEGAEIFRGTWRDGVVGTGPFRVVRFDPSGRLELEANPNYWRQGFPKSDRLNFTFNVLPDEILAGFRSGSFSIAWDLFPADVETLRRESDFAAKYGETPRLSTYYVVFNIHNGPLADETLRHELVQSVDVDSLVRKHLGRLAIPAHTLIPPGLLGYASTHKIRPSSGYSGKAGSLGNLELNAIINSVYEGPYSSLATDLLKTFRQRGCNIQNVGATRSEYYRALASATADLVVTRWIADYPDPDTFIHGLLHSEKGIIGRVCGTPEIDRLIEQARTESDPEVRNDIYREVEDIISQRALLLPLFHEQAYCFARPEVEGFYVAFSTRSILPYEKLWVRR